MSALERAMTLGSGHLPGLEAIIIAPFFDLATATSCEYTFRLTKTLEQLGIRTFHIRPPMSIVGEEAVLRFRLWQNRSRLFGKETLVIYAGHAFADRWVGQNAAFSFIADNILASLVNVHDAGILKDTIVVALPACLNGLKLAPAAIKQGCRAFFASTTYMYAGFPELDHDYMEDFHSHWATVPIALLTGKTCGEAFDIYRRYGENLIKEYRNNTWDGAATYAKFLRKNIDFFHLYGDKDARLIPWEK
jgi:hypothetical protein